MGVEQTVTFTGRTVPAWPVVRDQLARHGLAVQTRMIDGVLAFPDELPTESWRELRLGTDQGMVTLRRETDRVVCVTWGNADPGLRQLWNALIWGFAAAGDGRILTPDGPRSAEEFRCSAELPGGWGIS
jgi:hypothetical protein